MAAPRLYDLRRQLGPRLTEGAQRVRESRPDVMREEPLVTLTNLFLGGFVAGRIFRRIVR